MQIQPDNVNYSSCVHFHSATAYNGLRGGQAGEPYGADALRQAIEQRVPVEYAEADLRGLLTAPQLESRRQEVEL